MLRFRIKIRILRGQDKMDVPNTLSTSETSLDMTWVRG